MRKLVALATIVAFVLTIVPGAVAGKKKQTHQHVEGSVVLPQPYAADGTCIYRTQRTIAATAGEPNGLMGYVFEIDPKTVGQKFTLEVSDGAGMDIAFYSELGDPSDPTTAPTNMGYETPGPGGEKGTIPRGFAYGFVCMTEGVNGTFTYSTGM